MDIKEWKDKALSALLKHKYALVILVVGLLLMMIPMGKSTSAQAESGETVLTQEKADISQQLAQILSRIDGAGDVEVLLTAASGEQTVYQTDMDITGGENGPSRQDTVVIRGENGGETGLVQQINPPKYQGAIIVCKGADNAAVRLAIVEAVSRVTGLRTDQISVHKMK